MKASVRGEKPPGQHHLVMVQTTKAACVLRGERGGSVRARAGKVLEQVPSMTASGGEARALGSDTKSQPCHLFIHSFINLYYVPAAMLSVGDRAVNKLPGKVRR